MKKLTLKINKEVGKAQHSFGKMYCLYIEIIGADENLVYNPDCDNNKKAIEVDKKESEYMYNLLNFKKVKHPNCNKIFLCTTNEKKLLQFKKLEEYYLSVVENINKTYEELDVYANSFMEV